MDAAIAISSLVVIAGLVVVVVYLVHRGDSYADQVVSLQANLASATLATERATFETAATKVALASQKARADALTDFISHDAKETDSNADLDPGDVAGRVLRLSKRWDDSVDPSSAGAPPAAGPAVRVPAVAVATPSGDVHAGK